METFVNCWKNIQFEHESTVYPRTVEEVIETVNYARRSGRKIKCVGGRHGFNNNLKTKDILLDLRNMNRVLSFDKISGHAYVEAGITLADGIAAFGKEGFHFPCLGSWSAQSIAGAISTSTHSSTLHYGSLSDIVEEVEAVLSDGKCIHLAGDDWRLPAFRASIGQLGIVTKVKLALTPAFMLKCDIHSVKDTDGFKSILSIAREKEFVNMMWFPYLEETCIRILTRTDAKVRNEKAAAAAEFAVKQTRIQNTIKDIRDYADGYRFLANPDQLVSSYSAKMRRAFYADDGVIDQSYNVFRYDKYGEPNTNKYLRMILNTEHAIDVEQLESALTELKPLIEKFRILGKYINWPRLHVRFTKKSERTMIAMNSGRDTAYVGIYIIGSCLHEPQIEVARAIEKVLIAHGGRPHWGKFRYTTSDLYKETYPAFKTFLDLRAQLDPDGMFSDGFNLYEGLDYFLETPWAKILNSLTADDTYFPVRIL